MTKLASTTPKSRTQSPSTRPRRMQGGLLALDVTAGIAVVVIVAVGAVTGSAQLPLLLTSMVVLVLLAVGLGAEPVAALMMTGGMLFAPMAALQISNPPLVTYADVFFVAGMLLLAPRLLGSRLRASNAYLVGVGSLLTIGLVSLGFVGDPHSSLQGVVRLTYAVVVLPVVFLLWRPSARQITLLASAYVLGSCISVAYSIAVGPVGGRYHGLAPHANGFGHGALLAVALLPFLFRTQPAKRLLLLAAGALCFYGIWISGSRASLLVFALVLIAIPLVERSLFAAGAVLLSGSLLALTWTQIASFGDSDALARLLGRGSAEDATGQRLLALHKALRQVGDHPFLGNGFDNIRAAHNIYLQVFASLGLVGLIGLLLVLGAILAPLLTASRPWHRLAYPALAFVLLGPLTDVLFDTTVWAVLSLSMLASLGPDEPREIDRASQRLRTRSEP